MLFTMPSNEVLFKKITEDDDHYDGFVFIGLKDAKNFCKFICQTPKSYKEEIIFFQSITAALEAGYHPSDCCKPMDMANNNYPEINELLALIRKDPQKKWTESELILCGYALHL